MLPRYSSVRCGDCGQGLTWIEIAFGRFFDPVCGACLLKRRTTHTETAMLYVCTDPRHGTPCISENGPCAACSEECDAKYQRMVVRGSICPSLTHTGDSHAHNPQDRHPGVVSDNAT